MTIVVVPFLYVGTLISKNFAALLEEHDIFVPEGPGGRAMTELNSEPMCSLSFTAGLRYTGSCCSAQCDSSMSRLG
ncbi:single-pass membrane protein with aspartate-rich tail 1b [Lates japonicus]|uniref:Essential MCU regulator, mitochondrial n=1 Tax=Lates japonicus TaxID=270547 RepID=A0AAD3N6U7_LATJO|nr:single-pass membrane protein with aspartate-rich tail 1b [Lates japonicus]